ncbi:MAG: glycosyltransferase [Acidobacteria bacterium]|nr:glycosyltransferase [Acidobacteriota bacterium]
MTDSSGSPFRVECRAVPADEPVHVDDEGCRIYAVMVTGKTSARAGLARASVQSFLSQTYGNRVLVIVNDGAFDLRVLGLPADRVVHIRPGDRQSLGHLRNCGLDAVPAGAVWTYWDDDDWHHPRLMASQYRVMSRLGVEACFLRNQVKCSLVTSTAFVDRHPGGFAGTFMGHASPHFRFPDLGKREDSVFTAAVKHGARWYPWNNPPHYYLRFFHRANVWDEQHFGFDRREPGTWQVPRQSAEYLSSVLRHYPGVAP